MLYGETKITIESLKVWSSALKMEQIDCGKDHPFYDILRAQLLSFQSIIKELKPGDDWRDSLGIISQLFMEYFFKTPCNAIRLGNYYECFVVPADIGTKKKLIKGYAENEEVGEVLLYEGRKRVGSIGIKSDLIWSVFYNYFIVESPFGAVFHTLPNHEEFLSLQLWNVANKSEEDINTYIDSLLLRLSIEKSLNFKRSQPVDLWKSKGTAAVYGVQAGKNFEAIPLAYMNYGIGCDDPRMAFLHYYQVLEYFFVRAQNENLMDSLKSIGILSSDPPDDNTLRRALKDYTVSTKEIESLKLVLKKAITAEQLKKYIRSSPALINQYTIDRTLTEKILINLDARDDKIIGKFAERIYFFRCAIAHAKGDVDEYLVLPNLGNDTIEAELLLLKETAYQALCCWGKEE